MYGSWKARSEALAAEARNAPTRTVTLEELKAAMLASRNPPGDVDLHIAFLRAAGGTTTSYINGERLKVVLPPRKPRVASSQDRTTTSDG